ncbi:MULTISPECIES: glutamate--cysteine ligase [unclassified Arthrobacter]|uniref:carboxylate-amine ligase n=1 Tax=unclassified Arthrobacter TaxID=235627 RepID=UPI001E2CA8D3|nr:MULTISPECIES: glutamate--cysteine ligase [unclassified Arthrobacter]MCC9146695.1 glutamate--cysteine ligase [Arthrobacter sp. zg-Y919]MDK1277926.1 glutamate--cysteine ligase [Arthrobacter sp. zg.Y919]WIB03480.1 glutamate--cysteine ligase [Arthrobacter sp. zg-Y919]
MRTFGIEEEYLLVDGETGVPLPVGPEIGRVLQPGGTLSTEFKQEQIESGTQVHTVLEELAADIVACRATADRAAAAAGARAVALATSPLPCRPTLTEDERFSRMDQRFAQIAREQLTCGCHVHVGVESDTEGVAVLDRIRSWLPLLGALSANSPFWNGADTGFASYRSQVWSRWPLAGPYPVFGSAENYHRLVDGLLETQVPMDHGQIYFDARLSRTHPTVEVRIADVCLYADDAVLLAALVRALVETAAREWRNGVQPSGVPETLLRLAAWRAGRFGMDGELVDPLGSTVADTFTVAKSLLEYVRPVLEEQGEATLVESLLRQLLARGTGARRQRAVLARTGSLREVVADGVRISNLPAAPITERHDC